MTLHDFYWSTDREVFNWIQGHRALQWEQSEDAWNRARHQMYAFNIVYMPKGAKTAPSDFIRLHMDGEKAPPDPYEQQRIREWSDMMDSIPFSDPSEYEYYDD